MSVMVHGAVINGLESIPIIVEVDLLRRLPSVSIVGLANHSVKESIDRVRSAIVACGYEFPRKRVVINLAPADLPKKGTGLDLPIAMAILAASGQISSDLSHFLFAGELSLSGELRPIMGALSISRLGQKLGQKLVLPSQSASIANLIPNATIISSDGLQNTIDLIQQPDPPFSTTKPSLYTSISYPDLKEVKGQHLARRALEISAAGAHHLLLSGPPGCGKSMLAQRLPGILPPLSEEESLDCIQIQDLARLSGPTSAIVVQRPFRAPHHTSTASALIGDHRLRPGEISLAHHGVLFLDEAPEFHRNVLEVLREPLEEGHVRLCRAAGTVTYPASIILCLAANPCPCGFRNTRQPCSCSDSAVARYQNKLSGPLLDRIDLHVNLQPIESSTLFSVETSECSETVKGRVQLARQFQMDRGQIIPNGKISGSQIRRMTHTDPRAVLLIEQSMNSLQLSARCALRVLKVARTIADLEQNPHISPHHISEAIGFRIHKFGQ